jgi:hypothetical protein
MILFRDLTEIQGKIRECNLFYSPISPCSHNPWSSHNATGTLFLGWNTLHIHPLKIPKSSNMSCHTTTPEILDTFIISLVLVPKKTARPLDLFLTLLVQPKFKRQGSYDPAFLIKFYPKLITTPKSKLTTH